MVTPERSRPAGAEQRLKELGIKLPPPPEPFGTYVEAVQTGNSTAWSAAPVSPRSTASVDGSYVEGVLKGLAVMAKDSKKYATTGGWGFQFWAQGDPKKP